MGGNTSVESYQPPRAGTDGGNESDTTASTMSDLESPPRPTSRRIGKIGGHKVLPNSAEKLRDRRSPALGTRSNEAQFISEEANRATTSNATGKIRGSLIPHEQGNKMSTELAQANQLPERIPAERITRTTRDSQPTGSPPEGGNMFDNADETANRNRAMLKHDLEEKRKVPAKKKRKF